jgi:hypothetical protein
MRKSLLLFFAGLFITSFAQAQINKRGAVPDNRVSPVLNAISDSSVLPIVLLTVSGEIPDNDRIVADMKIIDHGGVNHTTDINYAFDGNITIENRGSSSAMFIKHSYGFTTIDAVGNDKNVSLLGLPVEHDWILKGEYQDRTMLRDWLTFKLARNMGRYAPRSEFCQLYLNDACMGLFAIVEKIKRDTFRVDIAKLEVTENSGLNLTGGYILKIDKVNGAYEGGFLLKYPGPVQSLIPYIQYEYPKGDKITSQQQTYIQNYIYEVEDVLRSTNFMDTVNGYRKYISVKSFIDYMISNEIARNVDGYRLSTFFYKEKDKDTKLGQWHMGPLWDFNLAYGYSGQLCGEDWGDEGWGYDYNAVCLSDSYYIPFWWDRLLQDPSFRTQLKSRWDELRAGPLKNESIMDLIDSTVSANRPAIDKNFQIWNTAFTDYIWPNFPMGANYDEEITYLKNFITNRLDWLDANIPEVHEVINYTSLPMLTYEIRQIKVYPVPFRDHLTFDFNATGNCAVTLSIYSINGQKLYSKESDCISGQNLITWDGSDVQGNIVQSGVYIYTLETANVVIVRNKIIKY